MNSRINNTCGGSFSTVGWLYWKTPLCVFSPVLCCVVCSRGLGSINHPCSGLYALWIPKNINCISDPTEAVDYVLFRRLLMMRGTRSRYGERY